MSRFTSSLTTDGSGEHNNHEHTDLDVTVFETGPYLIINPPDT